MSKELGVLMFARLWRSCNLLTSSSSSQVLSLDCPVADRVRRLIYSFWSSALGWFLNSFSSVSSENWGFLSGLLILKSAGTFCISSILFTSPLASMLSFESLEISMGSILKPCRTSLALSALLLFLFCLSAYCCLWNILISFSSSYSPDETPFCYLFFLWSWSPPELNLNWVWVPSIVCRSGDIPEEQLSLLKSPLDWKLKCVAVVLPDDKNFNGGSDWPCGLPGIFVCSEFF